MHINGFVRGEYCGEPTYSNWSEEADQSDSWAKPHDALSHMHEGYCWKGEYMENPVLLIPGELL